MDRTLGIIAAGNGTKEKYTRRNIQKIIAAAGVENTAAQKIAARIIEDMAAALIGGKVIELRGLGTLEPRERKARAAHNPRTLAPVNVPARRIIFFRPSGKLKNELKNNAVNCGLCGYRGVCKYVSNSQ